VSIQVSIRSADHVARQHSPSPVQPRPSVGGGSRAEHPQHPYSDPDAGRTERRRLLERLDQCLTALEDAHERDEQVVSPEVASMVQPWAPAIAPGMLITEALELVFRKQEEYLPEDDEPLPAPDPGRRPPLRPGRREPETEPGELDETRARALTDRIKASANQVSLLLLEAHEGRAWLALGYRSWEHYVRRELGLSRTRSYELLDHGRLIRLIHRITGTTRVPDIPPYAARRMKQHMAGFVSALEARVDGTPKEEMPALVTEVVRDYQHRTAAGSSAALKRRQPSNAAPDALVRAVETMRSAAEQGWPAHLDLALLGASVECLAAMPPVPDIVRRTRNGQDELDNLEYALEWLTEFAGAWKPGHRARYPRIGGRISGVA
jgi:hypothetical protein